MKGKKITNTFKEELLRIKWSKEMLQQAREDLLDKITDYEYIYDDDDACTYQISNTEILDNGIIITADDIDVGTTATKFYPEVQCLKSNALYIVKQQNLYEEE